MFAQNASMQTTIETSAPIAVDPMAAVTTSVRSESRGQALTITLPIAAAGTVMLSSAGIDQMAKGPKSSLCASVIKAKLHAPAQAVDRAIE